MDRAQAHLVLSGDCAQSLAVGSFAPNFWDHVPRQSGGTSATSHWRVVPFAVHLVACVLGRPAQVQVFGVHARRGIAMMQDMLVARDFPVGQHPRGTVCFEQNALNIESGVFLRSSTYPQPAVCGSIAENVGPEAFRDRAARAWCLVVANCGAIESPAGSRATWRHFKHRAAGLTRSCNELLSERASACMTTELGVEHLTTPAKESLATQSAPEWKSDITMLDLFQSGRIVA